MDNSFPHPITFLPLFGLVLVFLLAWLLRKRAAVMPILILGPLLLLLPGYLFLEEIMRWAHPFFIPLFIASTALMLLYYPALLLTWYWQQRSCNKKR